MCVNLKISVDLQLKSKVIISFLILVVLFLFSGTAMSQRLVPAPPKPVRQMPDTLVVDSVRPDTTAVDSVRPVAQGADSLRLAAASNRALPADSVKQKKDQLAAPVVYEANDSVVFTREGFAYLYGGGKVNYQQIQLESDVITMNMDSSTVYAHGVPDSLGTLKGTPIFKQGQDTYETNTIRYNFNSRRGLISNIVTQQGEGYVIGNNAKKSKDDDIYLKSGRYTTCENHEHPHFYMQMTYAKVRPKKNVVTGPAYLVIEDVPLPIAVPFFFFPFSSSYSSGIIMPSYMDDSNRGFGLTDGGYYFAISDHMDLKFTGDIFTKGSWAARVATNYVKRYKYSGTLQADYQVTKTGDKGLPDYSVAKDFKIVWSHRQDSKANPNATFSASVNFATSSYERTNWGNLYNAQAMSQNTKTSSVSYSRNFPDQNLSLSATANIAQTMRDSSIAITLPDLNISLSTIYPFKRKIAVGNERWYEKISLRYTGRLSNSITTKDNLLFKKNLIKDWRNGMQHNIPISATFTLFKYFNVTPTINYNERWYTHKINQEWDEALGKTVNDTVYGFNRVYDYNVSVGVNTKIYGMYKPLIMKKKDIQIRHIITPTVSFSAQPDFGAAHYGYWDSYIKKNSNGTQDTISYSPYAGQLFGVPVQGRSGAINFSLSNNLEMKYKDKNDTIHKISLIDELGANISYNMAAQRRPWSNLSVNLRLKLSKSYTFSMSSVFATYAYTFDKNGNVVESDRTEWSYGRFGRFQGYGTSFSYTLNNETFKKLRDFLSGKSKEEKEENQSGDSGSTPSADSPEGDGSNASRPQGKREVQAKADKDGYQQFAMPWSVNISTGFNISENRDAPINRNTMRYPYKFSLNSLNINGNIKISNKWAITFNSGYDFDSKKVIQTAFNFSRDLHCFTMTAAISPFGVYKYYNFTIRATASILQDLKWDQRSQTQSNIRWY